MPSHRTDRITAPAGPGATPWAYGKPHDYAHDVAGKAREAEVAARLAALRARLSGQPAPAATPVERSGPVRCDDCGYLTTAPGHYAECGGTS